MKDLVAYYLSLLNNILLKIYLLFLILSYKISELLEVSSYSWNVSSDPLLESLGKGLLTVVELEATVQPYAGYYRTLA